MPSGSLTLEEVFRLAMDGRLAQLNTAMPGRVQSYNAAKQTADIKPTLKRAVPTPDGDYILEELPVIPSVKVIHPGGTDWALHIPIATGDTVQLIINQWDHSEWSRTGEVVGPADKRDFSLAHAVALPGLRLDSKPITGASATNTTLHHSSGFAITVTPTTFEVGGNGDAAALASKVLTELQALVSTFNSHVHPYVDTLPVGTAASVTSPVVSGASPPASVASALLKVSS